MLETGSLIAKNILVGGVYYRHTMIIKGSNRRDHWAPRVARDDAVRSFRLDLMNAYLFSEEFREFVAAPQLTAMAKDIVAKRDKGLYGGEYGLIQFRDDLKAVIANAKEYGVSPEFAQSIYDFLSEKKSWHERHWILASLIVTAIGGILLYVLKSAYRKCVSTRVRGMSGNIP